MKILRIEIIFMMLLFISIVNGQNLYRSFYPDSILHSQKIEIPSYENEFNENVSFYYETWVQSDIVTTELLFKSNDTLYNAHKPSVFIENILPNYKRREKEDKVAMLDFTISILTQTINFDSIIQFTDHSCWGVSKYDLNKAKVEKTDTTFLFKNRKVIFNYCCKLEKENNGSYNIYYFFDHGKLKYRYAFNPDNIKHKFNYLLLGFYNKEDRLKFDNSLFND